MRTIETKVYKFAELSDNAKQKAIDWYRNGYDSDSAEWVIEDAKTVGAWMGIEIDKIYYSGFSSQGDGASYTGSYRYKKGSMKAVKQHTGGTDKELLRIASELQKIQRKAFYGLSCRIRQSGYYYHEMTMRFDIEVERQAYDSMEDDLAEALRDFARWIYKQLEKAYDWENSDEAIIENIEANEYEFTENGKIA